MANTKICLYCGKVTPADRRFAAHIRNCKLRPGVLETYKKTQQTKQLNSTRKDREFVCKCGKKFIVNLTDRQYEKKRHKKFCSRRCANTRKITKETKEKISKSLTKYTPYEIKKRRKISSQKSVKKYKLKKRKINLILGKKCLLCNREMSCMATHKKDCKPHKKFESMSIEEYKKEINSGKYVKLCYRCHKGVHFCLDILKINWDEIIKIKHHSSNVGYLASNQERGVQFPYGA